MAVRWMLHLLAVLGVALLVLSPARACIEVEPRQQVEFAEGSAELEPAQYLLVEAMFKRSGQASAPRNFRISVRGYADRPGQFKPDTWSADELALAQARSRTLAAAAKRLSGEVCVERVALGAAPDDAPPPRLDAEGKRWHASGLVVLAAAGTKDTPPEGVRVETDCGF